MDCLVVYTYCICIFIFAVQTTFTVKKNSPLYSLTIVIFIKVDSGLGNVDLEYVNKFAVDIKFCVRLFTKWEPIKTSYNFLFI